MHRGQEGEEAHVGREETITIRLALINLHGAEHLYQTGCDVDLLVGPDGVHHGHLEVSRIDREGQYELEARYGDLVVGPGVRGLGGGGVGDGWGDGWGEG